MSKTIVFVTPCELGQNLNEIQIESLKKALKLAGDKALLYNDIGLDNKVKAYLKNGLEGIKDTYRERKTNCRSECTLVQLPNEKELKNLIDEEQFKIIKKLIGNKKENIKEIIFEKGVPLILEHIIKKYNMNNIKHIFSERDLRNIVAIRTKNHNLTVTEKNLSWKQLSNLKEINKQKFLGNMEIVSTSGIPVCRGIMFALYEQVAMLGYIKIIQFIEKKHFSALTKAQVLFELYSDKLEQTKGKKLEFEYVYY
jgi:hypothetical protein